MFEQARIRLTAWYLLIIMTVSLMFSSILYQAATSEFTRFEQRHRIRLEQRIQGLPKNNNPDSVNPTIIPMPHLAPTIDLIDEVKERIIWLLFLLNSVVFVVAGVFGYLLAGRTLKPIQEMVDEQNRFISDASHELKTPLTSLKTAMEVHLREKKPSIDDTKTLLTESIGEVDKLQSLSESLLQLAQYEQPQATQQFEVLKMQDIIGQAVLKIKPLSQQKKIIITTDIENVTLRGTGYSLVDLFVILLDNAVKYSPEKSRIAVSAKKTDGHVEISVQDHGDGIAEKDLPHIFERFYRADSARTKQNTGGYGLGLSIAKKIIEAHKGTIHVSSKEQKGTCFKVVLPIK